MFFFLFFFLNILFFSCVCLFVPGVYVIKIIIIITNGLTQGCVLAPTLFSIILSAMFEEAFRDMGDGVYIQSRPNADLVAVAHFRAKTKTTNRLVRELLFSRRQRPNCPLSRGDPEDC